MYCFEEPISSVFEKLVRECFYIIKFSKDGLSLPTLVWRIKMKLDKEILGKILNISIVSVRSMKIQQPSIEFMQTASKVGGTSMVGVGKKFLEGVFQVVYEFVNKVLLPKSEKRIVALAVDLILMECLSTFDIISLLALMIVHMHKVVHFKLENMECPMVISC